MSMSVAILEALEKAQFQPAQARALARVLESEFSRSQENLVTKSDLKAENAGVHHEISAGFATLESRVGKQIAEAKAECLRCVSEAKVDNMRWTVLVMAGQTALLAGVMYFLLQNLR